MIKLHARTMKRPCEWWLGGRFGALLTIAWLATGDPLLAKEIKTLLLDTTKIERMQNIRMAPGQAKKSAANPLFGEEHPWEARYDNLYPNIVWDESEQLYKCWYSPFLVCVEDWIGSTPQRGRWLYRETGLCYAFSRDGVVWEKPRFDLLPFHGEASNILLRHIHGIGVFKDDRDPDAQRRYKLLGVRERTGRGSVVAVAFSADGLRWGEWQNLENVKLQADTHNNAIWAPTLGKYVGFTRDRDFHSPGDAGSLRVRVLSRIESDDFQHWSEPQIVLRGLEEHLEVYGMTAVYHAGIYLGFPIIFRTREDRVHVELAWSKDTIEWHRVAPGTPLIANSETPGAYDWGCVYPAAGLVIDDKGIRFYYGGSDGVHTGARRAYLALAHFRPDGFAAATPFDVRRAGSVITTPWELSAARRLRVTADVEPGGELAVALLDEAGSEIGRSQVMTGSFTSRAVDWVHAPASTRGPVRLQFMLGRASLYSYDFPTD